MNRKAQASLEFLLVFAALASIIIFYSGFLLDFNSNSANSLDFFNAKSAAIACAFAIDSLHSNSAFFLPQSFACFSDSNNSVASKSGKKIASVAIIPKARISSFGSEFFLEVEGIAHYK